MRASCIHRFAQLAIVSEVGKDSVCRVEPRSPSYSAAWVRARSAQVQRANRRRVARISGQRSHEEQLIRPQVAMEDVAFGDAERVFEIGGSIETARYQRALNGWHMLGQVSEQLTSQRFTRCVPTFRRLPRKVLHEAGHDVPAR